MGPHGGPSKKKKKAHRKERSIVPQAPRPKALSLLCVSFLQNCSCLQSRLNANPPEMASEKKEQPDRSSSRSLRQTSTPSEAPPAPKRRGRLGRDPMESKGGQIAWRTGRKEAFVARPCFGTSAENKMTRADVGGCPGAEGGAGGFVPAAYMVASADVAHLSAGAVSFAASVTFMN